ncbi:MAG TPA: RNA methyltransferase [Polyangiaceae bacterium]|nr:RNA methyltransferase [Polyangiaceae bacterium]
MRTSPVELPVHKAVRFLLVNPHYPENLGAACRAMKTMGFLRAGLVRPGRLAIPSHPMARKMAVKSLDVLDGATVYDNLDEAIVGTDIVIGSTARRGVSGVFTPATLAPRVLDWVDGGRRIAVVFGNEKSGLTADEIERCDVAFRIPMAAPQPSLNLAQAVQVMAYELYQTALERRAGEAPP